MNLNVEIYKYNSLNKARFFSQANVTLSHDMQMRIYCLKTCLYLLKMRMTKREKFFIINNHSIRGRTLHFV